MTTIIETERLILRTWKKEDADPYFQINQDPKVIEFLRGPLTMEQVNDFIPAVNSHGDKHGYTLWAACLKETGELIGFIGLNYTDWESHFTPAVEVGWRLGSQYWGKGFATEGAKASLEYGFKQCGLKEIISFTVPANIRSIRVMEKIGLKRDLNGDFAHPKLAADHPLSQHILYRLRVDEYLHVTEKYCFTVGNEGQASLNILEKSFNDQTKYFLNKHGLRSGLSILDIGCGLGYMSQYLAEIVGDNGRVTAIDNSENQIKAAKTRCPERLKNRIDWVVADIYELEKLNKTFDMVYCRFVLHHIHKPRLALTQISQVLKPDGIFIGIEGIINYAYSYPEQTAWPQLNFPIEVAEGENRNGNIGKMLPNLINQTNMKCIDASIYQPILIEPDVRQLLLQNECIDNKEYLISDYHMGEIEWQKKYDGLKACIDDETILIGFYAANFTASRKRVFTKLCQN